MFKKIFNANVLIDLVKSVPEKLTLSMTELLNTSSKHPQRSRDRSLKKFPKIQSTPTIKNRVRSPSPASSDSSPDSSHTSSSSRSFGFSYSIPGRRFPKSPSSSPQRSQSRSRSRSMSKSPNRLTNQDHMNGGNASARRKLNFYFHTSLFIFTFKVFIKSFEPPQRSVKIKI